MKHKLLFILLLIQVTAFAKKEEPADKNATTKTVKLYKSLMKLQEDGIMFGHQDDLAYGHDWYGEKGRSDVKDVCGEYPAVFGWELGHLELGDAYSLDSVYFDTIKEGIKSVYEMGGISTISWHLRNPLTGGTAWDVSSKQVVRSILPGGEKHEVYKEYLDKLADFFNSLKNDFGKEIPVLFRPFHENTGSWFWWGEDLCSANDYKALWRFTVEYLQKEKNVHNVLYIYSPDRFEDLKGYVDRYPGDDLIDIFAFDLYDRGPDFEKDLKNCANVVSSLAKMKDKIAAISETGGPLATDTEWWTKTLLKNIHSYQLSYVLVWRNPFKPADHDAFGPYKGSPDSKDFIKFHKNKKTIFLNKVTRKRIYK